MIELVLHDGKSIGFELILDEDTGVATVTVGSIGAGRDSERYPVFSLSPSGEVWRHGGLPDGMGIRLTKERKIKEIEG